MQPPSLPPAPPPTPEELANQNARFEYLKTVNNNLLIDANVMRTRILLAKSTGDLIPEAGKMLYDQFLGLASLLESYHDDGH